MSVSSGTKQSFSVVSGYSTNVIDHIPSIIGFLARDIVVNQKTIAFFENIRAGSLDLISFRYWLNVDELGDVVAIAFTRTIDDPVMLIGTPNASDSFWKKVFVQGFVFEGEVTSLDLFSRVVGQNRNFIISRSKDIMSCTALEFEKPNISLPVEFHVRIADETHQQQLTELYKLFAESVNFNVDSPSSIARMIGRGKFFIAYSAADNHIASVVFLTNPSLSVSRITFVYTRGESRRKGLSKALVHQATKVALNEGRACTLFVDAANHAAISTYEAVGFRKISQYQLRQLERLI